MKNTFKIKQEVKHFSWRFLTEWSDLEASAVITTLRWPPSPEDTLEHPYKHPSVTATNESSVIFAITHCGMMGGQLSVSSFSFPFLRSAVVLLIKLMLETWGTACRSETPEHSVGLSSSFNWSFWGPHSLPPSCPIPASRSVTPTLCGYERSLTLQAPGSRCSLTYGSAKPLKSIGFRPCR